jgi:hypothetical protein
MGLRKDIWRVATADMALPALVARGSLDGVPLRWLSDEGPLRFLADPFGLWRDGLLHIFAEAYDYRDRHGRIDCLTLDQDMRLRHRAIVLAEPWHLSYPFVFEANGETWMLPEAFRSGRLTLYRAIDFPTRWEAAATIDLPHVAIDATPLFRDGLWWLFHTAAGTARDKMGVLHLAFAERLTGPWRLHPSSPIRHDLSSSRPGGTPIEVDGRLALPMQDCTRTYGGAIRWLFVDRLTPERVEFSVGAHMTAPASASPYRQGLHTLSAAGPITLLDCKRIDLSPRGLLVDVRRRLGAKR